MRRVVGGILVGVLLAGQGICAEIPRSAFSSTVFDNPSSVREISEKPVFHAITEEEIKNNSRPPDPGKSSSTNGMSKKQLWITGGVVIGGLSGMIVGKKVSEPGFSGIGTFIKSFMAGMFIGGILGIATYKDAKPANR